MKNSLNKQRPLLIVITGLPGSGKTTYGKFLSRMFSLVYIDYDTVIRDFMDPLFEKYYNGNSYGQFTQEWRESCYGSLWNIIMENIKLGHSMITSAPLTKEKKNPLFFKQLKESYQVNFDVLSIDLYVPQVILKQRIIKRNEARDKEKLENWEEYYQNQDMDILWDADFSMIRKCIEETTIEEYGEICNLINQYLKK